MNIQDQDIYKEVERVINSGGKQIAYHLRCIVHTPEEDIEAFWVENRTLRGVYDSKNYADEHTIGAVFPMGTFNHKIVPYRDQLEVTFIRTPLQTFGEVNVNDERAILGKRYIAKLYDNSSPLLEANIPASASIEKSDRAALTSAYIQLIDKTIYTLRVKKIGGVLKKCKPKDAILAIMGKYSEINSQDGNRGQIKVDVIDGITEQQFTNVPLKPEKLVHFPLLLDRVVGGLYPTGLGRYFKDMTWYIYPLYDTERFKKGEKGLTLINVTADRFPNPEVSYLKTQDQLIVVSTAKVKHIDNSEFKQLNLGNGVQYLDAENSFKNFVEVKDNKIYVNGAKNTKVFLLEKRDDEEQWVPESEDAVTSFHNLEASKISERLGSYVMVSWENCDESLLRPGMPVRFLYMDGNVPTELFGTLLSIEVFDTVNSRAVKQLRHLSNAMLTIFINRHIRNTGTTT